MIGSIEEAVEITTFVGVRQLPNGWKFLAQGSYRKAFLSPSGVVYKRQHAPHLTSNREEYDNVRRIQSIPLDGWRVPDTELYSVGGEDIIAMEFVNGENDPYCDADWGGCDCGKPDGKCVTEHWQAPIDSWSMYDLSSDNVIVDDNGVRVLIDVAI